MSFAYDGQPILRDISFVVEPGEFVAVVGPSGSGKTTLLSLLPHFYEAQSGEVLIDGADVRRCRLRDLREQIAIVSAGGSRPLGQHPSEPALRESRRH